MEKLTIGPLVHSNMLGAQTPSFIIAQGTRFDWNDRMGCYEDFGGKELYVEADDADGTISPESYYEMP